MFIRMSVLRFFVAGLIIGFLCYQAASPKHINNTDLVNDPDNNNLNNPFAYDSASAMFMVIAISLTGTCQGALLGLWHQNLTDMLLTGNSFAVPYMQSHYRILSLENNAGLHSMAAAYASVVIAEFPIVLTAAICLGGILHLLMSIVVKNAIYYYLTVFVVMLTGYSLAAACSCWCSTPASAFMWYARIAVICMLFTGMCMWRRTPGRSVIYMLLV
jgi:hypothetical protein